MRRKVQAVSVAAASLLLVSLVACRSAPTTSKSATTQIRLSTGAPGGGFFPLGEALRERFAVAMPQIVVSTQPSTGAVANVRAIEMNEADLGLVFADVAYLAYVGRPDQSERPFDHLRAVAVLQLTPVQLVAAPHSAIRGVADLRNLRVGVGPIGSGTSLTASLILKAFGLEASVRTQSLSFAEAGARLLDGRLDAMFDTATYAESAAQALRAGGSFVSIQGAPIDRLRRDYPFLRMTSVSRRTYAQANHVQTLAVETLLLCRSTVDEGLVHDLTAALMDSMPSLASAGRWNLVDMDRAPSAPIPLHDGAARYYREQELVR